MDKLVRHQRLSTLYARKLSRVMATKDPRLRRTVRVGHFIDWWAVNLLVIKLNQVGSERLTFDIPAEEAFVVSSIETCLQYNQVVKPAAWGDKPEGVCPKHARRSS